MSLVIPELDVDWNLRELERIECEEDLYTFLQHAWRYIDPAPFADGWVIEAVSEHLTAVVDGEIRKLLINIPPRCSKSSMISVALPAWCWAQEQNTPTSGAKVPFLHASYGYALSLRDSVKCRRLIESPWYRRLWGHRFELVGDQNTKGRFANTKGGERLITSIGAGVTGEGGNIIVCDDPNAANEAMSEATTQATIEWWDGTMSTRLNNARTGAYIVVQQRLSEDDLSGHILSKDKGDWTHLCLPMRYEPARSFTTSIGWKDPRTEEGELLWPSRFGHKEIKDLEDSLGSWKAAGQLQQRPEPASGGVIKRNWWNLWPPEGEELGPDGRPIKPTPFPLMDFVVASLDTAYTTKTMNDYSALTVWGVFSSAAVGQSTRRIDPDGQIRDISRVTSADASPRVMLMHAWQQRLELHDLVLKVAKTCKDNKVDTLLIENKAAGHSVAQELRRLFSREGFSIRLHDPRAQDKLARLYSIQHLFEEGMIYSPDRTWSEEVIAQCGTFPNGKHDDLVDTVSQALRHMRELGLLARAPEIRADLEDSQRYLGRPAGPLYPV